MKMLPFIWNISSFIYTQQSFAHKPQQQNDDNFVEIIIIIVMKIQKV